MNIEMHFIHLDYMELVFIDLFIVLLIICLYVYIICDIKIVYDTGDIIETYPDPWKYIQNGK